MQRHLTFLTFLMLFLIGCKSKKETSLPEKTSRNIVHYDGTEIAFNKCGEGDTTLFFLHGWCINKEYWDDQIRYFCPRYKVVAIDLPGFGASHSSRTQWTFDKYADDIQHIITKLKLKNVILIGHSMSGDIILSADTRFPEQLAGIIGVDNLHNPGDPYDRFEIMQAQQFLNELAVSFDSTVSGKMSSELFHVSTPLAIRQRVLNDFYRQDSTLAVAVLRGMLTMEQEEKKMMKQLSHKLYLINSSARSIVPDSLQKYCRLGYELMPLSKTGHYPMIEKPEEFNLALQKVLNSIASKK